MLLDNLGGFGRFAEWTLPLQPSPLSLSIEIIFIIFKYKNIFNKIRSIRTYQTFCLNFWNFEIEQFKYTELDTD